MRAYLDLLSHVLTHGQQRPDRTGVGTRSVFGYQMRVNLQEGFPLLTTKKVHVKSVFEELLWMLAGSTKVQDLQAKGVTIWDEWATKEQCARFGRREGDLGPIYGHQWRSFGWSSCNCCCPSCREETGAVDQIQGALALLLRDPHSRRIVVSAWDPCTVDQVTLPPCHTLFQLYVHDGVLSCQLYQRSGDVLLGVPFNVASYALLTHLFAHAANLRVGELVHTFGDVHLYNNHVDQAREQLTRTPTTLPTLTIERDERGTMEGWTMDHLRLEGYHPQAAIKAPVAV